ncbi:putative NADH-flavin reductase [Neolewinella xylanilytica]|uniref:Putative NADH-flavin reductase n=1 Tax=Neolewinella xylanilytica TaxID=1514080 RepID=A0A2S6I6W6_9BACT|nr:NAD(P)H-binding protein [Neolewinella xylanilytica]PPK87243.1 putative NADH-flavin reductase [Neolewinella xylanilytica]
MKTIALFGGTGQTGRELLSLALTRGYDVKALVRNPAKLSQTHPRLQVIAGDVLNPADVAATVASTDVVLSVFGHGKGSPDWLQTDGTKNILAAMRESRVKKIISLSGGGLPYPEKDEPKFADKAIRFIMNLAMPKVIHDAVAHHGVLAASGTDWIIVRAPRLTNDAKQGHYREGWVGVNASTKIARADLAEFLIKQVEDDRYVHQLPFVSY